VTLFKHTRVYLTGPHLGPLHSTLWSWSPSCHHAAPRCHSVVVVSPRRRIWPQVLAVLLLIGAVSKAYEASVLLGVVVTVLLGGIAAAAVHGVIISAGERPSRQVAGDQSASWKADHVPASPEYKAAHQQGPRDWEQAS
jgi:hypothetical protein